MCSCLELLILNGMCTPDLSDKHTFLSVTGNSTNDYFLSSHDLFRQCSVLEIVERVESDHMPLKLTLTVKNSLNDPTKNKEYTPVTKYIWDTGKISELMENLQSQAFKNDIALAVSQIVFMR